MSKGVVKKATVEVGYMLGGFAIALIIAALALGTINYLQNQGTETKVQRIVVQREGDRRDFLRLIHFLKGIGIHVPKGVVAAHGVSSPHGLAAPGKPGAHGHSGHQHVGGGRPHPSPHPPSPSSPPAPNPSPPPGHTEAPKPSTPAPSNPIHSVVEGAGEAVHAVTCPLTGPLVHTCL